MREKHGTIYFRQFKSLRDQTEILQIFYSRIRLNRTLAPVYGANTEVDINIKP